MRSVAERTADLTSLLKTAMDSSSKGIRVAIPGIVHSYDPDTQTVVVQPAIREMLTVDNRIYETDIPLLPDVPVVMPRAGGYVLGFRPEPGDECLVIFADMCIDAWWQSGTVSSQADLRRHDLSDAFAVMGVWSQVNKPDLPDTGVSLQNDSGTAGVRVINDNVDLFGAVTINGAPSDSGEIDCTYTIDANGHLIQTLGGNTYLDTQLNDQGNLIYTHQQGSQVDLNINSYGHVIATTNTSQMTDDERATIAAAKPIVRGGGMYQTANLNDLMTPGVYWIRGDRTTQNVPVSPCYGMCEVLTCNFASVLMQRVTIYADGAVYTRFYNESAWQSWHQA